MDDLDRFFPVMPRNVPRDDLDAYLRMYADEAGAFRASMRSSGEAHAEWAVNTRIPKMRTLEGLLGLVGQPLGQDPNRLNDSNGDPIVSAVWLQRGINAANAATGGAARVVVDGIAGPLTAATTTAIWRLLAGSHGIAPSVQYVGTGPARPGQVKIAGALETVLAAYPQVADPVLPAHSTGSTGGATLPDGTPLATSVGIGIGQGIGLLALLGIGGYALYRASR